MAGNLQSPAKDHASAPLIAQLEQAQRDLSAAETAVSTTEENLAHSEKYRGLFLEEESTGQAQDHNHLTEELSQVEKDILAQS